MDNSQFTVEPTTNTGDQTVTLETHPSSSMTSPLKVSKRWVLVLFAALALFFGSIGTILLRLHSQTKQQAKVQNIKTQNVDLASLSSAATPFELDSANRVVINGQVQSQSILLTPTTQPDTSQSGQIYVDKTTGEVRYYNGTDYQSFATTTSLGDLQAAINQARSTTVVNSLQGTTGAITLTGSNGLSISLSGKQLSLNLPQSLTVTSSPNFANLTLSGTLNTNSFTANGRTYLLPDIGNGTQTICTDQALCVLGGGTAVLLNQASAQADSGGNTSIFINKQNSGNLIHLQQGASTKFLVAGNGDTTISGILGVNTITPTSSLSIGDATQTFTIQGSESSSIYAQDSSNHRTTLYFKGSASNDVTYYLDRSISGDHAICTDVGGIPGCGGGGGGGGVSVQAPATAGYLTKFVDGTTITNSSITDNGVTVTVTNNENLAITGALNTNNINLGTASTTTGTIALKNSGTANTLTLQSGATVANGGSGYTLTLPTGPGTANQCLITNDTNGTLAFRNCLSGAGGGTGGVISLNSLSGALTLNNTNPGTLQLQDANISGQKGIATFNSTNFLASSGSINTAQGISSAATPQFLGVSLGTASTTTGTIALKNSGTANTLTLQSGATVANGGSGYTLTLPTGPGTANQCLITNDTNGTLAFRNCLSGAGGGTGGVISLNSLSGALTLNNTNPGTLQLQDANISGQKGIATFNSAHFGSSAGTISLGTVPIGSGGTGITTTPTNGKLLIGSTGVGYVSASLTSSDLSVTITQGAGTIDLIVPAAGGATGVTTDTSGNLGYIPVYDAGGNSSIGKSILQQTGSDLLATGTLTVTSTTRVQGDLIVDAGQFIKANAGGTAALQFKSNGITFSLPTSGGGTQTICTSAVTCVAGGGQAVLIGPNDGSLADAQDDPNPYNSIFLNKTNATGDILLLQRGGTGNNKFRIQNDGTTTISANTNISSGFSLNTNNINLGTTTTTTGTIALKNSGTANTLTLQSGATVANGGSGYTLTLPTGPGTANQCLITNDTNGTLAFRNCLSGAGGGTGGVISLNSLSGALTLNNTNPGTLQLQDANISGQKGIATFNSTNFLASSGSINTAQGISSAATPQFLGVSLGTASTTTGTIALKNSGTANTLTLQSGATVANGGSGYTLTLPTGPGTANQCLITNDTNGTLAFRNCLSGAGGGTGGVISLNSLSGALTLNNTNPGTLQLQDANISGQKGIATFNSTNFDSASGVINTKQNINDTATPTFKRLTLNNDTANTTLSVSSSVNPTTSLITANNTNGTPTGNLLDLQVGGTSKFSVSGATATSGDITATGKYNTNTFTGSALTFGAAADVTIQAATGRALNLTGHNASTISTDSGAQLTLQSGSNTISLSSTNTVQANGALAIRSGGTTTLTLDTGGAAAVQIGTGFANAVTLGANTTVSNDKSFTANGTALFKDNTNVTNAFDIQNMSTSPIQGSLFTVDTTNTKITLNGLNSGEVTGWTATTSMGASLTGHTSVTANGYVYSIGGLGSSTVYYAKVNADGSVGTWLTTVALPEVRAFHTSVVVNGYVYVMGGTTDGTNAQTNVYYAKLKSDGTVGAWQTGIGLPLARMYHTSVTANGYIYAIGGCATLTCPSAQANVYYAKLNADGSVGSWQSGTLMTGIERESHSSVVANGYVYVIGGTNNGTTATSTVYYAKLNTDGTIGSWSTNTYDIGCTTPGCGSPIVRQLQSSVVANGYVYAIGGSTNVVSALATVYYAKLNSNGTAGPWVTAANDLGANPRLLQRSIVVNGYIYNMGGDNAAGAHQPTVHYTSTQRVQMAGSLDLVGITGQTLNEPGATGGSLTAGNTNIIGDLQVQGVANFLQGISVGNGLSVNSANASSSAFVVQNTASTETYFNVDATARSASGGNLVKIGNSTGTDTALTILQLDSSAGIPTTNLSALNGGLFYDTTGLGSHLRVIEGGVVKTICNTTDLGCGSNTTLQGGYTASVGGTTPEIILDSTRLGIDIQDQTSGTIGATQGLLNVRAPATASTLGASLFVVQGNGRVGINNGSTSVTPAVSYDLSFGQITGVTTARTLGVEAQTTSNTGGNGLTISAGAANGTGAIAGGTLSLNGGSGGTGSATGGVISILAGSGGNGGGTGGAVNVFGGSGGSGNGAGGAAKLQGGSAVGAFAGGLATLQGGGSAAIAGSNGGAVAITGANGSSTGTGGTGGGITIAAGNAGGSGNNNGGTVSIEAGSSTGFLGVPGAINIGTNNTPNTIQIGSTSLSAGLQTIAIGNNITTGGNTNIAIGASSGAGSLLVQAGTGGINIGSNTAILTNYVYNPSFESGTTTNWTSQSTFSSATISAQSGTGMVGSSGTYVGRMINNTANTVTSYFQPLGAGPGAAYTMLVTPGIVYTTQALLKTTGGTCTDSFSANIGWFDNVGVLISNSNSSQFSSTSGEVQVSLTATAPTTPTNAAYAKVAFGIIAQGTCNSIQFDIDNVAVTATNYAPTYFDGSFGGSALWVPGPANNSPSTIGISPNIQIGAVANTTVTQNINIGNNSGAGGLTNLVVGSNVGASSLLLQAGTAGITLKPANSTTAFQVQNASSNNVLSVNTSTNQVVLGKANTVNGSLVFNMTGGSNTITLQAGATSTSYSLTLPIATGAANECLQVATGTQLTWGTCGAGITGLARNIADTSTAPIANGSTNYLYVFTNSSSALSGGVLKLDNGNNTGNALEIVGTGNAGAGLSYIRVKNSNATPSGNLLELQNNVSSGTDLFTVSATGSVAQKTTTNSATAFSIQNSSSNAIFNVDTSNTGGLTASGITAASASGNGTAATAILTVTGGAGGITTGTTGQTAGAGSAISLTSGAGGNATGGAGANFGGAGGSLTLQAGAGGSASSGTAGNGGSITIQAGAAGGGTGSVGNINIGSVGSSTQGSTIHIADTSSTTGAQNITIGSNAANAGNFTTIQGGTGSGAITLQTGASGGTAGSIQIGNTSGGNAQSVTLGSNQGSSSTFIMSGTAGVSVNLLTGGTHTAAVCANTGAGGQQVLYDCNGGTPADYAEMYPAASGVAVGDVVAQGGTQIPTYNEDANGSPDWNSVKGTISQVVKATTPYSNALIGVASDNYGDFSSTGYNIKQSDNPKSIALVGRVNVKVTNENGAIEPGDYLTASATIPGYAMKATQAGSVIGQALNSFNSSTGLVMVFVRGQHWSGPEMSGLIQNGSSATLTNLNITGNLDITGNLNVSGATTLDTLTVTSSITTQTLTVNGNATFNGTLSVNGHILSANASGSTTVTPGSAACTSPTVTINGNDTSGTITITTGSGCSTTGTLATVTFAHGYGVGPRVLLTQAETNAAKLRFYNGSSTTTTFTVDTNTIPTDSTIYKYNYFIIQ